MAKFIKLLFPKEKNLSQQIQWRKVIDNEEDLLTHRNMAVEHAAMLFLSLDREEDEFTDRNHANAQAAALATCINWKVKSLKEGEKLYPILEVGALQDKVTMGMFRALQKNETIIVNPAGGWCTIDVIEDWGCTILETITKKGEGFPIDEEIGNCDTLVLENNIYLGYDNTTTINQRVPHAGIVKTIYALRGVDASYIIASLGKCKNVYISSNLDDKVQIDSFMNLFTTIPRKNIYINAPNQAYEKLKSHPLFATNTQIHNINKVQL